MAKDSQEPQVANVDADVDANAAVDVDAEALQARILELEAENAELRQQKTAPAEPAPTHPGRGRNLGAIALVVIAALVLALAVPAVWLNRMVSDTDVFVATVAPLADDPDIQNAVAAAASDAVIEKLDAQARLEEVLPEELQLLAVPVSQAVNEFITKQSVNLVESDQFAQAWETVSRVSHNALVTALTGKDTGAVGVEAGVITLDVGTLADQLRARLEDAGLDFVSKIPSAGIDKTIVLYESPALAQMTTMFDLITRIAYVLPVLGLLLVVAAIVLASDRRKAVLWLGGAITIAAVLPLQVLYFSQTYVAAQVYELSAIPTAAAQSAFEIIFRDLVTADRALVALGIVLWLGAILTGPARWATAMRAGLSGGLSGVASHLGLGGFGVWVRGHKKALKTLGGAGVVVILLLLPAPRTVSAIVGLALGYLAWILLVELFGAEPVSSPEEAEIATETPAAPA